MLSHLAHLMHDHFWLAGLASMSGRTEHLQPLKSNRKHGVHCNVCKWETIEIFLRNLQDVAGSNKAYF